MVTLKAEVQWLQRRTSSSLVFRGSGSRGCLSSRPLSLSHSLPRPLYWLCGRPLSLSLPSCRSLSRSLHSHRRHDIHIRAMQACSTIHNAPAALQEDHTRSFAQVQGCSWQKSCPCINVRAVLSDSRVMPAGRPVPSVPVIVISARPGISVPALQPGASDPIPHIPALLPAGPVPGISVAGRPAPAIPRAALAALGLAAPVSAAVPAPVSRALRPPAASTRHVSAHGRGLSL